MNRLIFKLLLVNLAVIGFVMAVVWLSIDTLAAGYFVTLMEKYHISPEPAHDMFVSAVHRYLIWACLAAVILAVLLSFLMMRRILAPLGRMTKITRKIAAGDFTARVPPGSGDEVGQLAQAFNRMAVSLDNLESMRRTLMIDVAHELRTPLTNIRGYIEALNDDVVPPSAQTFDMLQGETMRLAQLVEDVLHMARADAAHGHLTKTPVDMLGLIEKTLEPFSHQFDQKAVRVAVTATSSIGRIQADRERIIRVLRSLMDNAVRYTPDSGKLEIRVDSRDRQVRVTFSNTAHEVVAEDLPYLFERFYRGEKSRSREHGGAGIGLAIVKALVESHGGRVGAELNKGRFEVWFTLPGDGSIHL
ncbi:MAG: HAMP domain-containing protein [Desulfobacteraceae bacterium]|jgi:signal transduction histidine kinase